MEASSETPMCLVIARDKERLANLEESNKLLDDIQKVVSLLLKQRIPSVLSSAQSGLFVSDTSMSEIMLRMLQTLASTESHKQI